MRSHKLDEILAFSIQARDSGWTWRVYDLDGGVVAEGYAATKPQAHAAVTRVYGRPPQGEGTRLSRPWL